MHVRRIIIDQGYGFDSSWSLLQQRIGRALRSCSHYALPTHLRNVQAGLSQNPRGTARGLVDLFVAVHGQTQKYPMTIDLEKYMFIEQEIPQIQRLHFHIGPCDRVWTRARPSESTQHRRGVLPEPGLPGTWGGHTQGELYECVATPKKKLGCIVCLSRWKPWK